MSEKYAVIQAHRLQFPVTMMCRALSVSTAGYYAAQRRVPSAHAGVDATLRAHVVDVFHTKHQRYGAPRVHRELRAQDIRIGQKRVARLMQEAGLQARRRRAVVPTTVRDPQHTVVPNTLDRAFHIDAHACNAVWVSDITYIPTWSGMLYLAILLDLASRRVVGWATSASLDTRLPLTALERALAHRQPPQGLLHHSDRGSQGGFNRSSQHLVGGKRVQCQESENRVARRGRSCDHQVGRQCWQRARDAPSGKRSREGWRVMRPRL